MVILVAINWLVISSATNSYDMVEHGRGWNGHLSYYIVTCNGFKIVEVSQMRVVFWEVNLAFNLEGEGFRIVSLELGGPGFRLGFVYTD